MLDSLVRVSRRVRWRTDLLAVDCTTYNKMLNRLRPITLGNFSRKATNRSPNVTLVFSQTQAARTNCAPRKSGEFTPVGTLQTTPSSTSITLKLAEANSQLP